MSIAETLPGDGQLAETTAPSGLDAAHGSSSRDEMATLADYARQADAEKDWPEAVRRWRAVRDRFPDAWLAYAGEAAALRQQGRLDEAGVVLQAARQHFPGEKAPLHDLARLAEQRRDWTAAEQSWRAYLTQENREWFAHTGLAAALRELGRLEEAETTLLAARRQFPREVGPLHELARLAERRRDWAGAEKWWREYLAIESRHWSAFTGLAAALREQGRVAEAEALLLEQQGSFPQDPWVFADYAQLAEIRQEWAAALERWTAVRQRFPDRWFAYSGEARALQKLGRPDDAETVLKATRERLPREVGPLIDLARLAEQRHDWAAAEQWWRAYLALESGHWFAHTGLAAALREQGRTAEAEALLLEQQGAFPQELALFADYAQLAEGRRDWSAALERWAAARERFPDRWLTYSGEARTLRELGRLDEAETVLQAARTRLLRETGVLHDLARLAEQRGDWAAAEQWWGAYLALENGDWFAHTGFAAALREQGRLDGAEALLQVARERFPHVGAPLHDLAVLAERRRDWAAAEQWWRASLSIENPPWWAYTRLAAALSELGRVTEAETVLLEQQHGSPDEFGLFADYARLAEGRRDWPLALERWTVARERFPQQWDGYRGSALALRELGRLDEAETVLRAAQERLPRETGVLHDLARLAEHRRDWAAAEHWWRAFLALDDRRWFAHTGLATALYEQGKVDEALELLLQAPEWARDNDGLLRALADLYRRSGNLRRAGEVLDEAVKRQPHNLEILVARLRIAYDERDWQLVVGLTERFRGDPPAERHMFDIGRIRIEALIATGALAEAATEFEVFAAAHAGDILLPEIATNLTLHLRSLDLVRSCWNHLTAIDGMKAGFLGSAAVEIYRNLHALPGSEFLVQWILTQETPTDRVDWIPAGMVSLITMLNSAAGGPLHSPAAGHIVSPGFTDSFAAAYAMVEPSQINPVVRALLGPWSEYTPMPHEYVQIVERILYHTTETDWPREVFLFLLVMRSKHPDASARPDAIVATVAERLLERGDFLRLEHAAGLLLLLMGADMFAKPTYAAILETLQRNDNWLPSEAELATPAGLLRNLLQKTLGHPAPAVIGTPRPLRVALEVSGHLRGYKAAHSTWPNLYLDQHDVHVVVYCAKKVGHRPLSDGGHLRTLPPNLARAFNAGVAERGWPFMQNHYADFSHELTAPGEVVVTEQEMCEFYGARAAIVVDEEQHEYAVRDRVWRMYRGMYWVHQLALKELPECDLYVRLRPDYAFRQGPQPDWWDMFVRSRRDRVIFADYGRAVRVGQDVFMGDQFAFGVCEVMDSYTDTFPDVALSQAGRFFGHSEGWKPHESVALSTFYDGVAVVTMAAPTPGGTLNTPIPSAAELYQMLMRQIGPQPRHEVDVSLLEALRLDLKSEFAA